MFLIVILDYYILFLNSCTDRKDFKNCEIQVKKKKYAEKIKMNQYKYKLNDC